MGQSASSLDVNSGTLNQNTTLVLFTRKQVIDYFLQKCMAKLTALEIKALTTKLNITNLKDASVISHSDLAFLLGILHDKLKDNDLLNPKFGYVVKILYKSFKVLSKFPFLQDYHSENSGLTLKDLILASFFHSGRYKKTLGSEYDYLKLVFISLSYASSSDDEEAPIKEKLTPETKSAIEKPMVAEEYVPGDLENYVIEVVQGANDEEYNTAHRIKWPTMNQIQSFDEIDVEELVINSHDLVQLFTFFLIIISVPKKKHSLMQQQVINSITKQWDSFEESAISLVRYIDVDLNIGNLKSSSVSYQDFKKGIDNSFDKLFQTGFNSMFKNGLFSSVQTENEPDPGPSDPVKPFNNNNAYPQKKGRQFPKFEESKLVNQASLSLISNCLENIGSDVNISTNNLVKLYRGSESGFSIRSLELKIFKWQAPTLFLVGGKRLKPKTIQNNKRYQQFIQEYPRYFRTSEESKRNWQNDNDYITYAVLVKQPWRASNKRNFGDENTVIISLSPRLDYYKSITNSLKGELIYFNNLGLGLGFGNDQPINKNNIKKYLPGDVSLTVEANLEFAVFRHIANISSNASSYFQKSQQKQVSKEDFEDRFMITDLEVWGVGSTQELEEQRKQWEWEEKQAEARQSVNLKTMNEDRAFLEMVGLVGNNNASGGSV